MSLEAVRAVRALEHGGELRVADASLLAGRAHGARSDADLDDVRAGEDERLRHFSSDNVACLEQGKE